jgi:multiple sugar transport system permease protein
MALTDSSTGQPSLAAQAAGVELAGTTPLKRRSVRPLPLLGRILLWIVLIGFGLLFLYPFAWLLAASLKPRGEVFDNALIPHTLQISNYATVWDQLPLVSWLLNSLAIAVLAAGLVTISSSLVAFGFAYFRFPGRKLLFGLVLATMMLPGAVTLVPQYLIWKNLGLIGTWVPLFGMNLFGSAFYIFLQRQFLLGLPRELFEAARIDGASYLGLFRRIVVPLSLPSFIIIFLFEFQASWNNLQGALIYLNGGGPADFTVPLGISYAMTTFSPTNGGHGDYQYVMVAALLVTLPMLILFAFAQRYFIEGIATQGRKG